MAEEDKPETVDDVEVVESDPDVTDSEPTAADQKLVLARDVYPSQLPIIPISDRPLFPKMTVPMIMDDEPLVKMLIELAETETRFVGIVLQREAEEEADASEPVLLNFANATNPPSNDSLASPYRMITSS